MKQRKISWKQISPDLVEISLSEKNDGDPIGCARLTNRFKWSIDAYFAVLAEDKHCLNLQYDTEIEAGRQLAKLWDTMEQINIRDTEEFFFNFDELFSSTD